jgi:hypothetical protein
MIDNILYVNTASFQILSAVDASGVGLVPSASHAGIADSVSGTITNASTASYVAGGNVDGTVAMATSAAFADNATSAAYADNAGNASTADNATSAAYATSAGELSAPPDSPSVTPAQGGWYTTGYIQAESGFTGSGIAVSAGDTTALFGTENVGWSTAGSITATAGFSGSLTGNVFGNADTATSASHALTASYWMGSPTEQPPYKSGVIASGSWAGNPKTYLVQFASAFADANYSPVLMGGVARNFTVEGIVPTGFTASANSGQPVDEPVGWVAIGHGESA